MNATTFKKEPLKASITNILPLIYPSDCHQPLRVTFLHFPSFISTLFLFSFSSSAQVSSWLACSKNSFCHLWSWCHSPSLPQLRHPHPQTHAHTQAALKAEELLLKGKKLNIFYWLQRKENICEVHKRTNLATNLPLLLFEHVEN